MTTDLHALTDAEAQYVNERVMELRLMHADNVGLTLMLLASMVGCVYASSENPDAEDKKKSIDTSLEVFCRNVHRMVEYLQENGVETPIIQKN